MYRRVLGMDTAGTVLSVGYLDAGGTTVSRVYREPYQHSRYLVASVQAALGEAQCRLGDLDLIAVTRGPGSYTGLRLGAMAAKILSWSSGVPLVGVDALAVLAANRPEERVLAALPARSGQVYARIYRTGSDSGDVTALTPMLEGDGREVLMELGRALRGDDGTVAVVGPPLRNFSAGEISSALGLQVRNTPLEVDVPSGVVVARLGQVEAQNGTVDALGFLPEYVGPRVAGP